jgi:hypothetical protein
LSPCPIATAPVNTVTLPERSIRTVADSNGPRPVPLMPIAMPRPRNRPCVRASVWRAAKPAWSIAASTVAIIFGKSPLS